MEKHEFKFPVEKMYKIFNVSKGGYYNREVHVPSVRWMGNDVSTREVHDVFQNGFKSYGARMAR